MAMPAHYTYTIEPIEGREFIQRNFATLPLKAAKYGNRAVSLNERFSVIERGFRLILPSCGLPVARFYMPTLLGVACT